MRQLTDSEMAHLAAGWRRYKSEYETEPTHIWPFEHGFTGGLDTAAERIAALETQLRAESAELDGLRAAHQELSRLVREVSRMYSDTSWNIGAIRQLTQYIDKKTKQQQEHEQ